MSPLSHHQARQWIEQAADGLLNPEQQKQLEDHLKGCAECRAYADHLQQLEQALRATLAANLGQPSLPPQAVSDLVASLQENASSGGGSDGGGPPSGLPKIFGILLAVVLAALGLFYGPSLLVGGAPSATPTDAEESAPVATETATATATATLTASPTPTPIELVLLAVPVQNVNCRVGNSSQFDIEDTLFEGEEYSPNARGSDNLWVRFRGPVTEVQCWVFVDNLMLLVNGEDTPIEEIPETLLPFMPYPPTPTPPPTSTFTPEPSETAATLPECSDGIDNDGDGRIDYGSAAGRNADQECSSPSDDNEAVK